jgi:hypothetical protein
MSVFPVYEPWSSRSVCWKKKVKERKWAMPFLHVPVPYVSRVPRHDGSLGKPKLSKLKEKKKKQQFDGYGTRCLLYFTMGKRLERTEWLQRKDGDWKEWKRKGISYHEQVNEGCAKKMIRHP